MTQVRQKKALYLLLIVLTVPLALFTRSRNSGLPEIIIEFGGDTLYATCTFFVIKLLKMGLNLPRTALYCYLFCLAVELSQLYQADWINTVRHTFPFGLLLGYSFVGSDLVCYAAGSLIGAAISYIIEIATDAKHGVRRKN